MFGVRLEPYKKEKNTPKKFYEIKNLTSYENIIQKIVVNYYISFASKISSDFRARNKLGFPHENLLPL